MRSEYQATWRLQRPQPPSATRTAEIASASASQTPRMRTTTVPLPAARASSSTGKSRSPKGSSRAVAETVRCSSQCRAADRRSALRCGCRQRCRQCYSTYSQDYSHREHPSWLCCPDQASLDLPPRSKHPTTCASLSDDDCRTTREPPRHVIQTHLSDNHLLLI